MLFLFRYVASCGLVGGTATPPMDECTENVNNGCDSFWHEECSYLGDVVFSKDSVTDAHSCQALLVTLGIVYKAEYWVYDTDAHICTFYKTTEASCDSYSGPKLPDIDTCTATTTTPGPASTTREPATTTTETATTPTTPSIR